MDTDNNNQEIIFEAGEPKEPLVFEGLTYDEWQKSLEDKEAHKVSALAKLAKLGLTEDEAKAVIGLN